MAARIVTLIVFSALVVASFVFTRLYSRHRDRRLHELPEDRLWAALGTRPDGRATIVDFWTAACGDCRVQAEELKTLAAQDVRVLEVDAAKRVDVVRTFGVLSAPSTAVLAADGRLLGINRRLAPADVLQAQLGLAETPAR